MTGGGRGRREEGRGGGRGKREEWGTGGGGKGRRGEREEGGKGGGDGLPQVGIRTSLMTHLGSLTKSAITLPLIRCQLGSSVSMRHRLPQLLASRVGLLMLGSYSTLLL